MNRNNVGGRESRPPTSWGSAEPARCLPRRARCQRRAGRWRARAWADGSGADRSGSDGAGAGSGAGARPGATDTRGSRQAGRRRRSSGNLLPEPGDGNHECAGHQGGTQGITAQRVINHRYLASFQLIRVSSEVVGVDRGRSAGTAREVAAAGRHLRYQLRFPWRSDLARRIPGRCPSSRVGEMSRATLNPFYEKCCPTTTISIRSCDQTAAGYG